MTKADARAIFEDEIPGFSDNDWHTPFDQLPMDSLALVSLRARLERMAGYEAGDTQWTAALTPADLLAIFSANAPVVAPVVGQSSTRVYPINMPQMAMGGLSESWLFKELGDLHWHMLTDGLECQSSKLTDGNGNHLYATFTRITLCTNALLSYKENMLLRLDGQISRFGAGLFFSDITLTNGHAQLMSSFTMRPASGSNVGLLKGQPKIPPNCKIPEQASLPSLGREYRAAKASGSADQGSVLFTCDYNIVAQHDINGVGLLYFAAYPIITDICEARYKSLRHTSTVKRDVFYFANCEPDETLVFCLHRQEVQGALMHSQATLARKSDGVLMARLSTSREVFPIADLLRKQLDYVKTWQGTRATPQSFLVTLNATGTRQGVFWCLQGYQELVQLAHALGADQPVHGMRSGHLIMDYTDANLAALASYYAQEMMALQPTGTFILGGNCQGGVIAHAIALRLQAQGRVVSLLILMEQQSFASYNGAVALIFGQDSHFNPFKPDADPHAVFAQAYRAGYTVDMIPGAHGEFFELPNVEALAAVVRPRLPGDVKH